MKMLTDLPAWAGMAILLLVDAIVLALARAHDQRQFWRMLHCERQRMSDWAEQRADQTIYNLIKKMAKKPQQELEDVENGIPNTPLVPDEIEKEISVIAEEKSANAEPDKLPHYIWVALDDQVSAINWEIEQREQRIAELKEELLNLKNQRDAIEKWTEEHA